MWRAGLSLTLAVMLAACRAGTDTGPDMDVILSETPATSLAAYGLFEDAGADHPSTGVIAYDLINPLFTDHAAKYRFVFVPEGQSAQYRTRDAFAFPVGSVLVKTFAYAPDMRRPETAAWKLETRLLIHKQKGWVALPYVWNAEQTEAVYTPIGAKRPVETISPDGVQLSFTYAVPNANQCKTCHQSGHDIKPIGPKARNLNHALPDGSGQLENWAAGNILNALPEDMPGVPLVSDETAPLADRARAYLDINCAHCHKPDGSASNSGLWLEWNETVPIRLGINKHPTAAGRGSGDLIYIIRPGAPEASILAHRLASTEAGIAMPELGRSLEHDEGSALISQWIAAMEAEE